MKKNYTCLKCKGTEFEEIELPCEDCGTHSGVECINCGEEFDLIFQEEDLLDKRS